MSNFRIFREFVTQQELLRAAGAGGGSGAIADDVKQLQQETATLSNETSTLFSQTAALSTDTTTLFGQTAALTTDITTLFGQTAALTTETTNLSTQTAALALETANLSTQTAALAVETASLSTQTAALDTDVTALKTFQSQTTTQEIVNLNNAILDLNKGISLINNTTDVGVVLMDPTENLRKTIVPLYNNGTTIEVSTQNQTFTITNGEVLELLYDINTQTWSRIGTGGTQVVADPTSATVFTDSANPDGEIGWSISTNGVGDIIAIGAPGTNSNVGQVYIYKNDGNSWSLLQSIVPDTNTSQHGFAVSISSNGQYLAIGSPSANNNQGEVSVYIMTNGLFVLQDTLTDLSGVNAKQGYALELDSSGKYLVVGGPQYNNSIGAVWIYLRDGSTWTQQQRLIPTNANGQAQYGTSVSIDGIGAVIVIGGPNDSQGVGAVWVNQRFGQIWRSHGKYTQSFALDFGRSVHMDLTGVQFIVGAPLTVDINGDNIGASFIYENTGEVWSKEITLGVAETKTSLGTAVYINGAIAWVGGSTLNNTEGGVWKFTRTGEIWNASALRIDIPTTLFGNFIRFGHALDVTLDNTKIAIGAPGHNGSQGAAVFYE